MCYDVSDEMKTQQMLLLALMIPCFVGASEPGFVLTHQPLGGLANGTIRVTPVLGVSKYAYSDDHGVQAICLIHKAYKPPSDLDHPAGDHNLASVFGIRFTLTYQPDARPNVFLDASALIAEDTRRQETRLEVVRATLECLRLSTPAALRDDAVLLKAKEEDRIWLAGLLAEYNNHDKRKPFHPKQER